MEIILRGIAIAIEVVLLVVIAYSFLSGAWLTVFDLGVSARYKKILTVVFIIVGCLVVVFFIAHLTFLYPTV
jgi:hypothetical protein